MDKNRRIAYQTLLDIEEKGAYSNLALNARIESQQADAPAFIRELVYGVLENKIYLDYVMSRYLKNKPEQLKARDRVLLRMGIYQLDFMDAVPAYAALNESVLLAKKFCKGRDGFINGVLRNHLRAGKTELLPDPKADRIQYLSVKYSYEPWIVELWQEEAGAERLEELLQAGNRKPGLTIRANRLKTSRELLKQKLEAKGFQVTDCETVPEALYVKGSSLLSDELYGGGWFSVQDEASMRAAAVLDPQPGEFIIDLCAAPGGKTLFMAERMGDRGRILAGDIYGTKLKRLEEDARRCGIHIVETRVQDAAVPDPLLFDRADRVLADVPCSGLGVVRRKPEIKYKKLDKELRALPEKQLKILETASRYVKPGGVLVYSTCTISPRENGEVCDAFLKENGKFVQEKRIQLYPGEGENDGFFICRMRRQQEV